MTVGSASRAFGRVTRVLAGGAVALAIGAAVRAGAMQTPTGGAQTQTPAPGRQGQPAQPPTAAGRQATAAAAANDGPVRDASGAIIGYTNLAEIPGTAWRIHDAARPHPRVVTPGPGPGAPPSDAIILFDGKDLSKWV